MNQKTTIEECDRQKNENRQRHLSSTLKKYYVGRNSYTQFSILKPSNLLSGNERHHPRGFQSIIITGNLRPSVHITLRKS